MYAASWASMKDRWSHEPGLPLVNGGGPTLWHGTSHTEPHKMYATELGKLALLLTTAILQH